MRDFIHLKMLKFPRANNNTTFRSRLEHQCEDNYPQEYSQSTTNKMQRPTIYRNADKSLVRPGMKQARKHARDVRDFNNTETRAFIKFFFSCKARRHSDRNISLFPSWSGQVLIITPVFIFVRRCTCFRRFFRPLSGAQNCT